MYQGGRVFSLSFSLSLLAEPFIQAPFRNILQITLTVMTTSKWRENVCARDRERERRGMTSKGR